MHYYCYVSIYVNMQSPSIANLDIITLHVNIYVLTCATNGSMFHLRLGMEQAAAEICMFKLEQYRDL